MKPQITQQEFTARLRSLSQEIFERGQSPVFVGMKKHRNGKKYVRVFEPKNPVEYGIAVHIAAAQIVERFEVVEVLSNDEVAQREADRLLLETLGNDVHNFYANSRRAYE